MKERFSAMYCLGLVLLAAAPATLALDAPTSAATGVDPGSVILLCSGLVSVFAIRRLGR